MTKPAQGWYPDPLDRSRLRWWDGAAWTAYVAHDGDVTLSPLPVETQARSTTAAGTTTRMPIWVWALIAVVALIVIFTVPQMVALAALVALVTAIAALAKSTPTWLRLKTRNLAGAVAAASAVILVISASVASVNPPKTEQSAIDIVSIKDESPTPVPTTTPRSAFSEEVVTEVIAFEETTIEDPALTRGQTQITTPGQAGVRTLTYRVEVKDGKEVDRKLISSVVTTVPIAQVTAIGTYDAPPPPPALVAGSGCDPNYADACVPVASDVDCAWGSGNGPAYFDGVAIVVGSDIYDLDRDGDGYACEQ